MRLDKYLKVSRIFKRRTVAKDISDHERVLVNDKVAKPSTAVKEGDVITIVYGTKKLTVRVLKTADTIKKADADQMYEVIAEEKIASALDGALR
ncbi:MAG: RNA-binding S4 domain-containing protein [Bacillota bacterium]|nr:RNA-binding S4 domain-containing protein [Bacillota bacterium]